jgi:hypothetical protein
MNILEVSIETKNHCLNKAFRNGTFYLSIPAPQGSPGSAGLPNAQASFNVANNGMISLASTVQFAVPAGTNVNMVYISNVQLSNNSASNLYDIIDLEGDEIGDFTEAGIYLISAINISLTERNE